MASLAVSGICRITRDAEVRPSATGTWYSFSVAAYRKNVKEGKQAVDFFDADLYQKKPAPGFEKKLTKGRLIYIESAYLRNDQFKGQDGKDKSRVKLQIATFELLNDKVDEPEQKVIEKATTPVAEVKSATDGIHPSDLPPPMNTQKKPYESKEAKEVKVPEDIQFPADMADDEEPPF